MNTLEKEVAVVIPGRNYKERQHRISNMPFKDVLTVRMSEKNVKNVDLAEALGYPRPNVIAMMKKGSMRMPIKNAGIVAKMLDLDPAFVLGKIIEENDPVMWDAMKSVMGNSVAATVNECALLDFIRTALAGHDVDLTDNEKFLGAVTPVLGEIVARERAVADAAIEEIKRRRAEQAANAARNAT